ncbi:MAG: hypothetical protein ABSE79_15110 [Terriglobia bacterium]|jgi:hypothetical protein
MRGLRAIIHSFTILILCVSIGLCASERANVNQTAQSEESQSAYSIPGDRWLEIDLYWFEQKDIAGSVKAFWDRFQPLFAGVQGYRGLILNVGWTVGCVMEWSGDLGQRISLPQGSGQQHWVEMRGPLRGTTEARKLAARARFAKPLLVPHHGYDPWTYGDLKNVAAELREEAARRGIPSFKVGMLNYAWTHAYGEEAPWVRRHREAFTRFRPESSGGSDFSPYFDPNAKLHADPANLGGLPKGIPSGMPVHEAYAAQWGSLSKTVGLDALMLRDSFGMPVAYRRGGPWGPVAPSPEAIRQATAGVAALVRELKTANRQALIMMYSNAASAVADWRANGLDLEAVAKEGYLDIFVDQTWAGAWNEVGLRETDFWNNPLLGWTYQLGYTLLHAAMLADTKVRHYPLIETFDAWEDWDVIHTAPQRLRWGIWAYSHAAVKTPRGLKLPAGSYISWANQGKRLLDSDDVNFLAGNLNATIADARRTREVFGPTLVYSRESMQWQIDHAAPQRDIKEWIDEQAASMMKWPLPILSVTRLEWLPQVKSNLFVLQTPSHLAPQHTAYVAKLINTGHPVAILGSPAGGVDPELARLGGLTSMTGPATNQVIPAQARIHLAKLTDATQPLAQHVPASFPTCYRIEKNKAAPDARVVYDVDGNPVLTLNTAEGRRVVMWDPADVMFKENASLAEDWGGSGAAYALVAGALNSLLAGTGALHFEQIDLDQTLNVTAWRESDGAVRILAGNLEEGLRDDADMTRHTILVLPDEWQAAKWQDAWSSATFEANHHRLKVALDQACSSLLQSTR